MRMEKHGQGRAGYRVKYLYGKAELKWSENSSEVNGRTLARKAAK